MQRFCCVTCCRIVWAENRQTDMNPARVIRSQVSTLTDLPNIGPAMAEDLERLGIQAPQQLVGSALYDALCALTSQQHDPCVIDVFISVTRFMDGEDARPWWHFTAERKALRST